MTPHIFLVLTLVMPANQPDKIGHFPQDSIKECWDGAQEYVEMPLTQHDHDVGGIAHMAGCLKFPGEEKDL